METIYTLLACAAFAVCMAYAVASEFEPVQWIKERLIDESWSNSSGIRFMAWKITNCAQCLSFWIGTATALLMTDWWYCILCGIIARVLSSIFRPSNPTFLSWPSP